MKGKIAWEKERTSGREGVWECEMREGGRKGTWDVKMQSGAEVVMESDGWREVNG